MMTEQKLLKKKDSLLYLDTFAFLSDGYFAISGNICLLVAESRNLQQISACPFSVATHKL